jgi:hypothetical protein
MTIGKLLFKLSGAEFYMDYLLITNPKSKTWFIRKFWFSYFDPNFQSINSRLNFAYSTGYTHLFGLLLWIPLYYCSLCKISLTEIFFINLFINIYPIIIQVYIGSRCYKIINFKNSIKNINYVQSV